MILRLPSSTRTVRLVPYTTLFVCLAFARWLEDSLVVEEKHGFIEGQMKELLYNFDFGLAGGRRPSIVGKHDEAGEWILPSTGELTPAPLADAIARRIPAGIAIEAADTPHDTQHVPRTRTDARGVGQGGVKAG